jgi:DNA-binding protein WhiA
VRNNVNRRINSEVANITKVASASAKQLEAIKTIKNTVGLEALPDDLKEIAYLRLENPEMSLRTLGENLTPPISRSGANHRMQRLLEYAHSGEEHNGTKHDA